MKRTIEDLKILMSISADASLGKAFEAIADYLMNYCVIKTNGDKYRIIDFEFYYFNQHHQDITTHPRNSEALHWYINDFGGIDLNFKSRIEENKKPIIKKGVETYSCRYKLSDESYFGGILIRQIQRLSDKVVFDGPLKVAELFRTFSASTQSEDTPTLTIEPESLEKLEFTNPQRHNILGSHKDVEKKVDYNLKTSFVEVDDTTKARLLSNLRKILKEEIEGHPYRYCWKNLR